jgi:hypothetical protein
MPMEASVQAITCTPMAHHRTMPPTTRLIQQHTIWNIIKDRHQWVSGKQKRVSRMDHSTNGQHNNHRRIWTH